jgi:hypothetical protein
MRFRLLVASVTLAALAAASGYAQSRTALRVDVPFEFKVNNTALPAGEYWISQIGTEGGLLLAMRSGDSHHTVLFTGNAAVRSSAGEQSSLKFARYGSNYFLADIWWAEDKFGVEVPASKSAKELAAAASLSRPEAVVIASR